MNLTVASWNIEKNGQSSGFEKQSKVSDFIDVCCKTLSVTVVFLCEVHSARKDDYKAFLNTVYGRDYRVDCLDGGNSNGYILLTRHDAGIQVSQDTLRNLNRGVLFLAYQDFSLCLAHFKSGQTGLTKDQLVSAADFLEGSGGYTGKWGITGDMNWDFSKVNQLTLPHGAKARTCWTDQTQKRGGILDWCLAGHATEATPVDMEKLFSRETFDMAGPDHKPTLFNFGF